MNRALIVGGLLAAVVAAAAQDGVEESIKRFKAAVPAARREMAPAKSAAELAAAALTAAKVYDEWIPSDFAKASGSSEGLRWYKVSYQEATLMGLEADRLLKNCKSFGGDADALAATRSSRDAAVRFLKFIDERGWPKELVYPVQVELRKQHVAILSRWKTLAECFAETRHTAPPQAQAEGASDKAVPLLR